MQKSWHLSWMFFFISYHNLSVGRKEDEEIFRVVRSGGVRPVACGHGSCRRGEEGSPGTGSPGGPGRPRAGGGREGSPGGTGSPDEGGADEEGSGQEGQAEGRHGHDRGIGCGGGHLLGEGEEGNRAAEGRREGEAGRVQVG